MPIKQHLGRLQAWWSNAESSTKVTAVASSIVLFAVIVATAFWAATPDFEPVFTGVSESDSAKIATQLKERGIPVQVSSSGSVVSVPSGQVQQARIEMHQKGLPSSGAPGYSRLGQTGIGQTQLQEQTTLRIAMEEEIQNTIERLDPVESARVHISVPKEAVFAADKQEPSAGITLKLSPGARLSSEQVQGIVHLVSFSVDSLKPERVSIVDSEANPIWESGHSTTTGVGTVGTRRKAELEYAERMRRTLQQSADEAAGQGKTKVLVHAELNFDSVERKSVEYTPLGGRTGAKVSEASSVERYGPPAGGGSAPTYPAGGIDSSGRAYQNENKVANYNINEERRTITEAPGDVERLNVSVLIDKAVPPETVAKIKSAISGLIGADNQVRNVICEQVEFDKSEEKTAEAERAKLATAKRFEAALKYSPLLLLLLVAVVLARILGRNIGQSAALPQPALAAIGPGYSSAESGMAVTIGEDGIQRYAPSPKAPDPVLSLLPALGDHEPEPELINIIQFTIDKPDKMAALLKQWLKRE